MPVDVMFSLRLSLMVAMAATLGVAVVGTFIGYWLATRSFRGRTAIEIGVTLPLILPPTVTGYYLLVALGRENGVGSWIEWVFGSGILFTPWACVVASFVVALPLMARAALAAFQGVDPVLVDTARTLGYGEWERFWRVMLPMARHGLGAGAVLSFARAMGEFGATIMIAGNIPGRTDTMPVAIYTAVASGDWNRANGMVVILTVTSFAFLYAAKKLGGGRVVT